MNESVIIGTLLGDAWIQKQKNKPNSYMFSFSQSNEYFARWKAELIGEDYSIYFRERFDKRTNKSYNVYTVYIKASKQDKIIYYHMFYSPIKQISDEVISKLDPLAICVWYLDDGNVYYNGNNCHITLAVNGFDELSKGRIIRFFQSRYDLHFKKTQQAIRITSRRECEIFMSVVEQYIPECMQYKKLSSAIEKYDKTLTDEQRKYRNNKYK